MWTTSIHVNTDTDITYPLQNAHTCYTCMHVNTEWTFYLLNMHVNADTGIILLYVHVNAGTHIHVKYTCMFIEIHTPDKQWEQQSFLLT